jgi:hypothetical protein
VSRESAQFSFLSSPLRLSLPTSPYPTILTLGPKRSRLTFYQQHEPHLRQAVVWLAGWLSVRNPPPIRPQSAPRSFHLKPQPIHLNQHLNQPWSESAKSVSHAQLSTTKNGKEDMNQRTAMNLWKKGRGLRVFGTAGIMDKIRLRIL